MERAFRKELEENLNHETWIERMILDGDKPPIIYWQSLETKECYEEPPFGSYKTVHLDDVVLVRKPKPQMSPSRPLKADLRREQAKAERRATKQSRMNAKKDKAEDKRLHNSEKRKDVKEWKSKFGSFMFKSKKNLVEI